MKERPTREQDRLAYATATMPLVRAFRLYYQLTHLDVKYIFRTFRRLKAPAFRAHLYYLAKNTITTEARNRSPILRSILY